MTHHELDVFLLSSTLLCAAMFVFNALKHRKRGISAIFLSAAFLVLGALIYMYRTEVPQFYIEIGAVLLFVLLGADFLIRVGNPPARKGK